MKVDNSARDFLPFVGVIGAATIHVSDTHVPSLRFNYTQAEVTPIIYGVIKLPSFDTTALNSNKVTSALRLLSNRENLIVIKNNLESVFAGRSADTTDQLVTGKPQSFQGLTTQNFSTFYSRNGNVAPHL